MSARFICTTKRSQKLVFRATEGLNFGRRWGSLVLGFDEGLVGWVATREEPLNLEDASAHPQFQLVEGSGGGAYSAPSSGRRSCISATLLGCIGGAAR